MTEPSGKYAIYRPYPGAVCLEIYRPDGTLASATTFGDVAAIEFVTHLAEVVSNKASAR